MEEMLSFVPMLVMQAIYAIFVAQIAKRRKKNVPAYVIASLVDGVSSNIPTFRGTKGISID